jgi:radial spoke head protein 3
MRNAEYTEIQRLEDVERRRTEEKDRRIREQITLQKEKTDALEKIAARAFAQSYLHSIIPDTLEKLTNNGYFVEHIEKELETVLMPWLSDEVEKSIKRQKVARLMVDCKLNFILKYSRHDHECYN